MHGRPNRAVSGQLLYDEIFFEKIYRNFHLKNLYIKKKSENTSGTEISLTCNKLLNKTSGCMEGRCLGLLGRTVNGQLRYYEIFFTFPKVLAYAPVSNEFSMMMVSSKSQMQTRSTLFSGSGEEFTLRVRALRALDPTARVQSHGFNLVGNANNYTSLVWFQSHISIISIIIYEFVSI